MKSVIILFFCCFFGVLQAQNNRINLNVNLNSNTDKLIIEQKITYYNNSTINLSEIYLHNWPNSYSNRNTPLTKRLIADYDKSLYFAKERERGFTKINNLLINDESVNYAHVKNQSDILKITLNKNLAPKDSVHITVRYQVKIPSAKFTKYGKTKTGYHLRFWYLVPAVYKNGWQLMSNLNLDDLWMNKTNYNIVFITPKKFTLTSNLAQTEKSNSLTNKYYLTGKNKTDILVHIDSVAQYKTYKATDFKVVTNVLPKSLNTQLSTNILNRQIRFIDEFLGKYPHKKILIDKSTQEKNPIYGLNQLPKFLSPFSDVFTWDLTILKALSKKYIENTLLLNRRSDYWLTDGLQTYLLMEYVRNYYPEVKLLGKVANIWGVRSFNIAKLKFNDKYPFVYQFSARQFLDQSLTTPADSLSNFNRKIVSKYKAGLGLQYLKGYLGDSILKHAFQKFYQQEEGKLTSSRAFQKILTTQTNKNLSWFFYDYIKTNKKIDYTIQKITPHKDSLDILIKNKRNMTAPVALYGVQNKKIKFKTWVTQVDSTKIVRIAKGKFDRVSLNYEQLYPEYNSLDNWRTVKKSLLHKPIQFRFFKDIQDPYYHQLFYQPEFGYNYYDGVGIGLKLHNKPILARNFTFKVAPTYATKSNSITGYFSLMYNQYFETGNIKKITYGLMGSNSHYAPDLSYGVLTPYLSILFKRNSLRDVGSKALTAKFVTVNKQIAPNTIKKEADSYSIFNLNYFYSKPTIIKGVQYQISTDIARKFVKFSADFRYRKLTDANRQLDFRLFAGFFARNKTTSNYFSFGLDRPSDYLFEQEYFGRSESSGFFSQQVIISDGGFKSVLPTRFANQFMLSANSSIGLWRWIEFYNDAAMLKNNGEKTYFAYENGIRFNFIHNILELYFPIYSNLGWEVSQTAYPTKIRFVLTLRPSAIYNFIRRGFL